MTDPNFFTPWPTGRVLKRKAPGLAVVGRNWVNIRTDSIPYLMANLFEDLPAEHGVITAAVNYSVSEEGQYVCALRLVTFTVAWMPYFSYEWQHMAFFTRNFLNFYRKQSVIPTQYINYSRDGFYTVLDESLASKKICR